MLSRIRDPLQDSTRSQHPYQRTNGTSWAIPAFYCLPGTPRGHKPTSQRKDSAIHSSLPSRSLSAGFPPKFNDSIKAESAQTVLRERSHHTKITPSFRFTEGGALFSYPRLFLTHHNTAKCSDLAANLPKSPKSHGHGPLRPSRPHTCHTASVPLRVLL